MNFRESNGRGVRGTLLIREQLTTLDLILDEI